MAPRKDSRTVGTPQGRKVRAEVFKRTIDVGGVETDYWDVASSSGFLSQGWPTKKLALERRDQHLTEHETGEPAPPKADLLTVPEEDQLARGIAEALAKRNGA